MGFAFIAVFHAYCAAVAREIFPVSTPTAISLTENTPFSVASATAAFPLSAVKNASAEAFAVNIVAISYFQSVERARPAMLVTVLRGFVFMVACFFGLPLLLGVEGIWLAVPLAEVLTFGIVMAIYYRTRRLVAAR